jgi:hypothetical protein
VRSADDSEKESLRPYIEAFSDAFGLRSEEILSDGFLRIAAISHRPYGAKYAA